MPFCLLFLSLILSLILSLLLLFLPLIHFPQIFSLKYSFYFFSLLAYIFISEYYRSALLSVVCLSVRLSIPFLSGKKQEKFPNSVC